ncbi:hypothetical protein PIROE2DRAFT_13551, partial [Piromyces sp. E2]
KRKSERNSKLKILHTLEHIEKVQKVIEGAPLETLNSDDESDNEIVDNTIENTSEIEEQKTTSDDTHKKNIESISEYKGNKTLTTVTTVSGIDLSNPLEDFEDEINRLNGTHENKNYDNNNNNDDENEGTTKHREYLIKSIKQKKKHNNNVNCSCSCNCSCSK